MICEWCRHDHQGFACYAKENERNMVEFVKLIEELHLIHVFISNEATRCPICGAETEVHILPIAGPAHPATPIKGHKGIGCIGPWIHNKALMEAQGGEARLLPCHDPKCNEAWGQPLLTGEQIGKKII